MCRWHIVRCPATIFVMLSNLLCLSHEASQPQKKERMRERKWKIGRVLRLHALSFRAKRGISERSDGQGSEWQVSVRESVMLNRFFLKSGENKVRMTYIMTYIILFAKNCCLRYNKGVWKKRARWDSTLHFVLFWVTVISTSHSEEWLKITT